jgi:hypothetical protein
MAYRRIGVLPFTGQCIERQRKLSVRDNPVHSDFSTPHTPNPMNRRHYAITLQQASEDSPTLAKLAALTRDSSERVQAIELLIPAALSSTVQAGPIDGTTWCLLVKSNAAAAKIRQLLPALQAHLRSRGWEVNSIRLKIQT